MKKIILAIFTMAGAAFTFQSCMQPADHSKEQAKIDSLANLKVTAYRDSLKMICMNDVMAMATARADSMMQEAAKKSGKKYTPKKTTTSSNSGGAPTSVKDRSGSVEQPKSVTDRKGTSTEGAPKSVTDRKGTNKQDTIKPKH